MAIINQHSRTLPAPAADVAALLDGLAGPDDRLWPAPVWPAMRLDRPLGIGATGGHGPVRYTVVGYQPGQWVRFRFTGPRGFDGFHEFTVEPAPGGATLTNVLAMHARGPARISWPLAFRPLHDAVLEDTMDRAEFAITGTVRRPATWSRYVRALLRVTRPRAARLSRSPA